MGGDVPKQWRMLAGRAVLIHTIEAFRDAMGACELVIVVHPDDLAHAREVIGPDARLVQGGTSRTGSVRAALEALASDAKPPARVLIHDGARPLVSDQVIGGVLEALGTHKGAAPALPVTDALWIGRDGIVQGSQDRSALFRAQTPQGFDFQAILAAHRAFEGDAADDVEIARAAGHAVAITQGDETNIKLTYPADFERAELVIASRTRKDAPN